MDGDAAILAIDAAEIILRGVVEFEGDIEHRCTGPLVEQTARLFTGDGHRCTMTGCEDAGIGRIALVGKVGQVGTGAVLIHTAGVAVVHQHPCIRIDQAEHAGALNSCSCLLQVVVLGSPLATQSLCGSLLDAVALAFGLEEHVIQAVVVYDVGIDGVVATVIVEHLRLGEVGKVLVGIRVVGDVVLATFTDGIVYHVLVLFGIVDGLRSPYLCEGLTVESVRPTGGEIDGRVGPVDHIL